MTKSPRMTGSRDVQEKREFPRVSITRPVICSRYGRQMTMRTLDISLGGLKLEANFDLTVGESMDLTNLINDTIIPCKGRILATEDFKNKVHARLRFASISDKASRQLSDYLNTLARGKRRPLSKWVMGGLIIVSAYIAYLLIRAYFFR